MTGQTTVEPVTDAVQESSGDLVIADNNVLETSTVTEEGSGVSTESATVTANNSEDVNNTETPNTNAPTTETLPESTTEKIECICDCIVNGNQATLGCSTQSPQQASTDVPNQSETTVNPSNDETTLTNAETTEPQITTVAPPPVCSTSGVQAHESDCKQYYDCSLEGSLDGNLHLLSKSCPGKQAFNSELKRCSRDISYCSLPVQCLIKGGLPDATSNSSYYLCEPRLIGLGFRVFHVDCADNEIFYPELGKCYVDFNNLPTQGFPPYNWNQIRDIDIVKAELKLLKDQDKLKLKQEKERKKAEEKAQKELEKEAKKKAKEQEKLNKEKVKQEAATFACAEEGNHPSVIGDNVYIACVTKKGKLKAVAMQCTYGATFDALTGTCINSLPNVNASISEEEDDD